ncbi:MAG: hypothetical protein EAX86_09375 [Candidatus Heimdallarchaeota archaeon]|nr:hypothetical protein [Candidatus Heimdallarchaeota archaeon]
MLKNEEGNHQGFYLIQFKKALYWMVIVLSGYLLYYLSWAFWIAINAIISSGFQFEAIIISLAWIPALALGWAIVSAGMTYLFPTTFRLIPTLAWMLGWIGGVGVLYKKKTTPDAKLTLGTLLFFLGAIVVLVFGKEIFSFYTSTLMLLHLDPLIYLGTVDRIGFYWLLPLWLLSWSFFWLKRIPQIRLEDKILYNSTLLWVVWFIILNLFLWMYAPITI